MRRTLLIALCLASALAAADTVDLTKMPVTPPLEPYKLPPAFETRLANGMEVILVNDARFPVMQLRLGFRSGEQFDPPEIVGLADTVAALLKEGTAAHSALEFAEALADIGGSLNASADSDSITISGNVLSENTGRLLELAAEMVRSANFPDEEIALRKQNRIQELQQELSDPAVVVDAKLHEVVFGDHPYSRFLPTPESIGRISREELVKFRDTHLAPNNAVLVLVGPVADRDATLKMIESRFGDWKRHDVPAAPKADFPERKRTMTLVDRPGSVQADVRAGGLAVNQKDPRYYPLLLANTILGGGTSSRMFRTIREEKGYAYDAHSELSGFDETGLFTAVTQVRNDVAQPGVQAVLDEMRRMGSEPVPAEEIEAAKNYRTGLFAVGLETPSGVAGSLVAARLRGLPSDYLEKYIARIQAVTAEQIGEAAKEFMDPAKSAIVVVGDASKVAEPLGKLGEWKTDKVTP